MTELEGKKRKSDMRWQQGRQLYSSVCPSLPTASHVAVLMVCWFHASGNGCRFAVANCQIAAATTLSLGRVKRIMSDLIHGGVIKTTKEAVGRGHASERFITGKPYQANKRVRP